MHGGGETVNISDLAFETMARIDLLLSWYYKLASAQIILLTT